MSSAKHLRTHELYADQLLSLKLGYALYEPDPGEGQDEVHVGDVGYIFHGRFKRLANVFSSELGYPAVASRFHGIEGFADLDEGIMASENVKSERLEIKAGGSEPLSGASVGVCVNVSCSSDCGASLVTKYRAKVERSPFPDVLKEHFLKYSHSWLADAQRQRKPVKNLHDLILVTGRVMTGDWATIAFSSRTEEHGVSFNIKAVTVTASGTVWGRWSEHVNLPKRHGPSRRTPTVDGEEPPLDQCIFIETFRVYERPWYARLKAAIFLKRKDGPIPEQPNVGKGERHSSDQMDRSTFDSKLPPSQEGSLTEMPEVVTAYHALAFRAFDATDLELDLICIDEDDIKRTSSDFGTFSVFSEELDDYDEEEVVVERVEKWGEPSGFKVGRIGRSMDELYHLYASGGAFDVIDSEDMEYLEHATVGIEDSLETGLPSTRSGFPTRPLASGSVPEAPSNVPQTPPSSDVLLSNFFNSLLARSNTERASTQLLNSQGADPSSRSACPKCEGAPDIIGRSSGGGLRCKNCGAILGNSDGTETITDENASRLEPRSPLGSKSNESVEDASVRDGVLRPSGNA